MQISKSKIKIQKLKLFLLLLSIVFAVELKVSSAAAFAIVNVPVQTIVREVECVGKVTVFSKDFNQKFCNVGQYLAEVIKWAARLGSLAAVLMIVYAGSNLVISGGNPERVTQSKEIIIGALLGLAVIFLLGAFLEFLVKVG